MEEILDFEYDKENEECIPKKVCEKENMPPVKKKIPKNITFKKNLLEKLEKLRAEQEKQKEKIALQQIANSNTWKHKPAKKYSRHHPYSPQYSWISPSLKNRDVTEEETKERKSQVSWRD